TIKGFNNKIKYKKINKNLVGFRRATEVTVNNIDNSYNQHMHVLVCVESTYFYNTENYVNQKQWIQFWKRAMKLDYDPKLNPLLLIDRKSTRLNSSHVSISYAVFCLKKNK